ncbi:MAG TPA: HAMP domain-containing sensor histidine kinase [Holophagaceae bacterium]|nr:HAMP domain-containing sensor histidine kinase [Holophagaceae bacterium]
MADFSNSLPDPLDAARRRHGFSDPSDLAGLQRLVDLAARGTGGARLTIGDRGGQWFEAASGLPATGPAAAFALEGTDVEGRLEVAEADGAAQLTSDLAALALELLRLRRLGAERRRQPRGPEGASFVPGVVHELRNFLFAMGAGLDAFEARFGADSPEAAHGGALRKNLLRLQEFLEELAEYGNPGALAFALQPVEPVLGQTCRLAEALAGERGVRIVLQAPSPGPFERMDRTALERALRRIVELTVLETHPGGVVSVEGSLLEGGDRPWLELGISGAPARGRELDPARLFEPFYYREKAMSRLGPAIARRLIEAHGGQVSAGLERGGLRLRVMLPVWKEGPK